MPERNIHLSVARRIHLTAARRRALTILMDAPDGCTEAAMVVYGFSLEFLADLVRDELVNETLDRARVDAREIEVVRLKITDKGHLAINGGTRMLRHMDDRRSIAVVVAFGVVIPTTVALILLWFLL